MMLAPFAEQADLQSVNKANDGFELPEWWEVEAAEPEAGEATAESEGAIKISAEPKSAMVSASWVAAVYALALVGIFLLVLRRRPAAV